MDDGHIPLASCSRTFLRTPTLWKFTSECKDLYNESDFGVLCWWTFITNCEEIQNDLSKLNCRSHIAENCIVAMIRGLRQALTRIGCLQAFESGPTAEEPCPPEMADYDHVYYDNVTGASLSSEMCERSNAAGNQVHERGARSRERARTPSDWDLLGLLRTGVIPNILSSAPDWLLRRRKERRRWI